MSFKMKVTFTFSYFVFSCYTGAGKEREKGWKRNTMKIIDAGHCARGIFLFEENAYNPGMQD